MIWNVLLIFVLLINTSFSQQSVPTQDPKQSAPPQDPMRQRLKLLSQYLQELKAQPMYIPIFKARKRFNEALTKIDEINARIDEARKGLDLASLQKELGENNKDIKTVLESGIVLAIDRFTRNDLNQILLYRSQYVTGIKVFRLRDDDRARVLSGLCEFERLRELNVDNVNLTDDELTTLVKTAKFESLEILTLSHNLIHAPGAFALAETSKLPVLKTLDLSFNRIDDEGRKALTEAQHSNYKHLEKLILNDNNPSTPNIPLKKPRKKKVEEDAESE